MCLSSTHQQRTNHSTVHTLLTCFEMSLETSTLLNLDMATFKELAIRQLEQGEPVQPSVAVGQFKPQVGQSCAQ